MHQKLVSFLRAGCVGMCDDDRAISQSFRLAAVAAEESDAANALIPGSGKSGKHIRRIAASRKDDEYVARIRECVDLAGEDIIEPIIVADAGQNGSVGAQRNGREGAPVSLISTHQLAGQMLSLGGTAAISADQQLMTGGESLDTPSPCFCYFRLQSGKRLKNPDRFQEMLVKGAHVDILRLFSITPARIRPYGSRLPQKPDSAPGLESESAPR
jgi:hypothetical protein